MFRRKSNQRGRTFRSFALAPDRLLAGLGRFDPPDVPVPDLRQVAGGRKVRSHRKVRSQLENLRDTAEHFARTGRWPRRRRGRSLGRPAIALGLLGLAAGVYTAWSVRRSAPRFSFVTEWFVPAEPEAVWQLVADPRTYPDWWQSVFLSVEVDEPAGEPRVGSRARYLLRGRLPYQLRFETVLTEVDPPRTLAARSTGDLVGTGRWTIEATLGGTLARYAWDVSGENLPIRLLAPVAYPALEWNHGWVMDQGERGIQRRLAVRH